MRAWLDLAVITHTKQLDGEFVATYGANSPFRLDEGVEVAFVPPQLDVSRRAHVQRVTEVGEADVRVRCAEIDSIDLASALVGCHILVRREDAVNYREGACEALRFTGWQLLDAADGQVAGTIVSAEDTGFQVLLEVERAGRTYAVPCVDECVVDIDEDARTMTLELAKGLFDL